jgi:hypothetical protein
MPPRCMGGGQLRERLLMPSSQLGSGNGKVHYLAFLFLPRGLAN